MQHVALRKRISTTTALANFIGKVGDITIDITKKTLVVHDGQTAGGIPLALANHTHPDATDTNDGFMSAGDHHYLYNHTHPDATETTDGFMSAADKLKLDGIPPGGGSGSGPTGATSDIPNTLVLRDANGDFQARNIGANQVNASGPVTAPSFVGPLHGNADTVTNGVRTDGSYNDPAWLTGLAASKIIGQPNLTSVPWSIISGRPTSVSAFANDAGYITSAALASIPWINVSGRPTLLSQFANDVGYITAGNFCAGVNGQTASPIANAVMIRDGNGRAQVAQPAAANDIATKAYVDANVSGSSYRLASFTSTQTISNPGGAVGVNWSILSVGEGGILYKMYFDTGLFGGLPSSLWPSLILNINTDGGLLSQDLYTMLAIYGDGTAGSHAQFVNNTLNSTSASSFLSVNNNGWTPYGGFSDLRQIFTLTLNVSYKSSLAISITGSISATGTYGCQIGILRQVKQG